MTIKDIRNLFDRIKRHYNMFGYDDLKIQEWYKFLKDYDPKDIDKNFDKYLLDIHDNPPMVVSLTRGLKKRDEIEEEKLYYIVCPYCKARVLVGNSNWDDYEIHHRKCSKIDFIDRQSKEIRGEGIDKEHYRAMSDDELNERYHKIMENWIDTHPDIAVRPGDNVKDKMNNLFQKQ